MSDSENSNTQEVVDEVQSAANDVADKAADVADKASSELRQRKPASSKSTSTTDETTTSGGSGSGASKASSGGGVPAQASELWRNPSAIPSVVKNWLQFISPERSFLVFALLWTPCVLMALGHAMGYLLDLGVNSLHYVVGGAAAFYLFRVLNDARLSPKEKTQQVLWITSVAPVIMVDGVESFLTSIVALLAFGGTVFLLREYFPYTKEHKESEDWALKVLEVSAPTAATFVIAAGGTGYVNSVLQALCFFAAVFAHDKALPLVEPHWKNLSLPPQVAPHRELLVVLLELFVAHTLLIVLSLLLPESLFATQNSIVLVILYSAIGAAVIGGSIVLSAMKEEAIAPIKMYATIGVTAALLIVSLVWAL